MMKRIFSSITALALLALAMVPSASFAQTSVVGRIVGASAAPAPTSCGTAPTITGSDLAGTVTMGTGTPTGCVITFSQAYALAPHCVVTWIATPLASQSYVTAAATITLTQTATSSNVAKYVCVGQN